MWRSLTGGNGGHDRLAATLVPQCHQVDGVLLPRPQPRLVEGSDGAGQLRRHPPVVILRHRRTPRKQKRAKTNNEDTLHFKGTLSYGHQSTAATDAGGNGEGELGLGWGRKALLRLRQQTARGSNEQGNYSKLVGGFGQRSARAMRQENFELGENV